MKVLSRVLISLTVCHVLAFAAFAEDRVQVAARSGKSVAGTIDSIPFIVLRGSIKERGQAMGELWGEFGLRSLADIVAVVNKRDPKGWEKLAQSADRNFIIPDEIGLQMEAFISGARQRVPLEKRSAVLGRDIEVKDLKATYAFADLVSSGSIDPGGC